MMMGSGRKDELAKKPIVESDDDDEVIIPSAIASVVGPIFRVANEIQHQNPRVAYLCRFVAFQKAHELDPLSRGVGVSQFMKNLLRRLENEEKETIPTKSDPVEILQFYCHYCESNLVLVGEKLRKSLYTASILYEVLKEVVPPTKIDTKTKQNEEYVRKKIEEYESYHNILPLHLYGITVIKSAIMELPEIKIAVEALQNLENLPVPMKPFQTLKLEKPIDDIFMWLSSIFGFQKANVANQREHLILLLANAALRKMIPEAETKLEVCVKNLESKLFENYISWCNILNHESNCRFPEDYNKTQLSLIYISLYLLIWGEASNIRFMPECLCYIFHHMAMEVYVILHTNVHPVSGEAYESEMDSRDDEYFLRNVITPIYVVTQQVANRSDQGSNSRLKNYKDLNDKFWSKKCFSRLGWPINCKSGFFGHSHENRITNKIIKQAKEEEENSKINFEESTIWNLYRNFDRMWIFFTLSFQAMVIVAWNSPSRSVAALIDGDVFQSISSIFITFASMKFLRATLDIVVSLKTWKGIKTTEIVRYLLKFSVAALWVVLMAMGYSHNLKMVAAFLLPNILAATQFILPPNLHKAMATSNLWIITLVKWWTGIDETQLHIGTNMYDEDIISKMKYTLFWVVLLSTKLAFSYYVEIAPLVEPTKDIMNMSTIDNIQWHEVFPHVKHKICVIIATWAPIVLVYFMDTQIWYVIFSNLFGAIRIGVFSRLGEITTIGMLRSRFQFVPLAFSRRLIPSTTKVAPEIKNWRTPLKRLDPSQLPKNIANNFIQVWNEFINSMREEDLINYRDRDLLLVPYCSNEISTVKWPPFLLADKVSIALDIATDFKGTDDDELFKKIKSDGNMYSTVIECYESLRDVIHGLLEDKADKMIVEHICKEVDESLQRKVFLNNFRMSGMPSLSERVEKFLGKLLSDEDDETLLPQLINVLQDIMEIITQDVMINGHHLSGQNVKKEQRFEKINLFQRYNKSWREKVVRLHLLLIVKESAINVPQNLDARRRITFFANSLFMNMPRAPEVRDMLSFSILTSHYKEDVLYTDDDLKKKNEDGITTLFYLQKTYPDEWLNFLDRIRKSHKDKSELIREWVSYRRQTLYRTVRGMMYYKQALELQCFLELAGDHDSFSSGYRTLDHKAFSERAQVLVDLKFTYVVSCQFYGVQKESNDPRDQNSYTSILKLMLTYPSLRVAYIDTKEETVNGKPQKVYYSVLLKGGDNKLDKEIYRIKLPGPPTGISGGKLEIQNQAIIFTRGEALQTIDMNHDNYFEEAYKMRNVLEEFIKPSHGDRKPKILAMTEHKFTGRDQFHYGHPDILDRIFHITSGIIKASEIRTLSEDIFAGYNSTLRGGFIKNNEYIQVGKGRDVRMNQISVFEAKVSNGNAEQTTDYRLARHFNFYGMLSFYFTSVGFYFSCMVTVVTVYVFLYGRLYMVLSGVEREILNNPSIVLHNSTIDDPTILQNKALGDALATQSVFQLGLIQVLPIVMEIGLEKGFPTALGSFIIMQLQLASVFFTFQMGTNAHYYGTKFLHYGSSNRETSRGFGYFNAKFGHNYRLYSRSHYVKGLEILILLIVYEVYRDPYPTSKLYLFITFSMWFLVASWLFAPFVFNPIGFDLKNTVDDWRDWKRWMGNRGNIGISPEKCWDAWWDEEDHIKHMDIRGRVLEILLAFRFFIYQFGIVYHLDIANHNKSLMVYGLSWLALVVALLVFKMEPMRNRIFWTDFQHIIFRVLKALCYTTTMSVLVLVFGLTISDLFAAMLAFLPTGWAIVLIGQACRGLLKRIGLWESLKELARTYDYIMGLIIFTPKAIFSWFPFVSDFQTFFLFNKAYSRDLQISAILAGGKENTDDK
ncbi:callose synthase 7-like [Humulus lupulus]|uniref:callose synthase 7-like n=1 Tax=Humulus lupulus TaxID=3486 RepID=UPI002B402CCB|nr:callose synthase 7-like [Humulus lupulus]